MSISLCFSGGVSFPYSMSGCIQVLTSKGVADKVSSYSSSGNGCFFSLCMCLGLSVEDIRLFIPKFLEIKDSHLNTLSSVCPSVNYGRVREFFETILISSLRVIPTFKQLYLLTNKTLHIPSYKKDNSKVVYFDRYTSPEMSVLDALCLSCCYNNKNFSLFYRGDSYSDSYYSYPLPITCFKKTNIVLCFRMVDSVLPLISDLYENLQTSVESLVLFCLKRRKNSRLLNLKIEDCDEDNVKKGCKITKLFLSCIDEKKVFTLK